MKIKIEIKSWLNGSILFEYEKENNTIKDTVEEAVRQGISLNYAELNNAKLNNAELNYAELNYAKLNYAELNYAKLNNAKLNYAELNYAKLNNAELNYAELNYAELNYAKLNNAAISIFKNDMFAVLLNAISEVANLKKAVIDGRIDGSTYVGKCACLFGTLEKSNDKTLRKRVYDLRDSSRPIEVWFTGIREGNTPENNMQSKLALEWIEEFEQLISNK